MVAFFLFGLWSARADAPLLVAPSPADLSAAAEELTRRVEAAELRGVETANAQNSWVRRGGPAHRGCEDPVDLDLARQAADSGARWRDAAQSARAQADRVEEMLSAPTITPLLDESALSADRALVARAREGAQRYLEASAWQATWLSPVIARCGASKR